MIMTDEQRDFLGKLRPGQAAVFRTGLERATFVKIPQYYPSPDQERRCPTSPLDARKTYQKPFRGWGYTTTLSDERVIHLMDKHIPDLKKREQPVPFASCSTCKVRCKYRDGIAYEFDAGDGWLSIKRFQYILAANFNAVDLWKECARLAEQGAIRAGYPLANGAQWCYFVHVWNLHYGPGANVLNDLRYQEFHEFLEVVRREALTGDKNG
jgi:hypothetical protein